MPAREKQGGMMPGQPVGRPWVMALLAAVYFISGKLGLTLAFVNASTTAVWPPTGIALAAFLLLGSRVWPGVFLGAFLVNETTAGSIATSLGIAAGNTLEGLVGAYLVNRYAHALKVFDRPQDIFKWAVLAALVSTVVSATIGVTSLCLGGYGQWGSYAAIWLTWWLGDAGGGIIVTPLLILWSLHPRIRWTWSQAMEAAILVGLLILVDQAIFCGLIPSAIKDYPLEFMCIPFLVWVAFRFSQREAATVVALLSGIAIWGTLHGTGPFARTTQNESLLLLQAFMGVVAVSTLALAALVAEHRRAQAALQQAHDELERRVVERTGKLSVANDELRAEVAERKRVEQQLRRTHEELKTSHEALESAHLQVIQAAKMESVGHLAAGVAHEVKNPLAVVLQGVDYLSKRLGTEDGEATLVLQYTRDAVRRADTVIRGLLDFAATRELFLEFEDLTRIVEEALLLVKHDMDCAHVTVVKVLGGSLPQLKLDHNKITQVFVNVFMNAIHAMPDGGTLTVRTYVKQLTKVDDDVDAGIRKADRFKIGETVAIVEVEDTGPGIPDPVLEKVFDPFFTTKPVGKGTGLGLTVTQQIVDLHGGAITIGNRKEGGVKVTIVLRAQSAGPHKKTAAPQQ